MINALLTGLMLGGMYALIALGLTLQYGVARIMNLAYGEVLIAAAFAAHALFTGVLAGWAINPFAALLLVVPLAFLLNLAIYVVLLRPLVRRAPTRDALEVDSILATFGLAFILQGIMLSLFGGAYYSYAYLATPVQLFGASIAANRLVALAVCVVLGSVIYLLLTRTRAGTAIRAVAVDPAAARLVAIDVGRTSAITFAMGGALVAAAGVLVSTFLTFGASAGVVFTMKALIVVVMGGVGNMLGCLVAGLALGLSESFVASYVDPGLTLAVNFALFLVVLLVKPAGLFGRATR
jgi:branched-chain amino acid transport system permease protein